MAGRVYKNKKGKRIKSTTGIISYNLGWNKGPLMYWANQEGLEGRRLYEDTTATDAGTCVHDMIYHHLHGTKPDLTKYPAEIVSLAMQCFENFLQWKSTVHFQPVYLEHELVSDEYGYGSTLDCVAMINDKLSLFDWKSSKGTYPDMVIQCASYIKNWNENNPDNPIDGGAYLLRIDKESASYSFHWWQNLDDAFEAFLLLLKLQELEPKLKRMV